MDMLLMSPSSEEASLLPAVSVGKRLADVLSRFLNLVSVNMDRQFLRAADRGQRLPQS